MATDDTVLVINDYNGHGNVKRRTSSSGRQRVTVSIRSEPVLVNADPRALSAGMAQAVADHFRDSIDNTTETPKPNTLRARQSALKAFVLGKPWALARYSGGRTGSKPPARTDHALADSHRLRDSIKVTGTREGWIINVAANRISSMFTAAGGAYVLEALSRNIPGWGKGPELMNVLSVRRAFDQTKANMLRKANERGEKIAMQLFKTAIRGALRLVG